MIARISRQEESMGDGKKRKKEVDPESVRKKRRKIEKKLLPIPAALC
jgi:hypothetical protein